MFFLLLLLPLFPLYGLSDHQVRNAIHHKKWQQAASFYQTYREEQGDNTELLTNYALSILAEQVEKDEEASLLALLGASLCAHEGTYAILEKGTKSSSPLVCLVALKLLSTREEDTATTLIKKALHSPFLPLRVEALFILAKRSDPHLPALAEMTMARLPDALHPLFPQIFASYQGDGTQQPLRKFLQHGKLSVQMAAVLSCARYKRDDLLSSIQMISNQAHPAFQEACAYALGVLGAQITQKNQWLSSSHVPVALATARSIYRSEKTPQALQTIFKHAQNNDLFAIRVLGEMGSEDPVTKKILKKLLLNQDPNVRMNAAFSLLELRDAACLPALHSLLVPSPHHPLFIPITSAGQTLSALQLTTDPSQGELSLRLREKALALSLELEEKDFLQLAQAIIASRQVELIPLLMQLLGNKRTEAAHQLLEEAQHTLGSPLIRTYSLLELYAADPQPSYREALKQWVHSSMQSELIHFRSLMPTEHSAYTLTPVETARLLIETYENLIREDPEEALSLLLETLKEGHPNNRPILAGFLLKALES